METVLLNVVNVNFERLWTNCANTTGYKTLCFRVDSCYSIMFYRGQIGLNWFEIALNAHRTRSFEVLQTSLIPAESSRHWAAFQPCSWDDGVTLWPPRTPVAYSKALYCIICVCDGMSVLSGRGRVLIQISFFSPPPLSNKFNSSPLPCFWCWQCYTTIRQRFVNVFHQLHLCMVFHCGSRVSSSMKTRNCHPKRNQAWSFIPSNSHSTLW